MPTPLRIGVNALYLIPGGVGGTEIYLRNLLAALAEVDKRNQYFIFVNRETGPELCPRTVNFHPVETGVRAKFRPGRLIWEQLGLPLATREAKLDVLFNAGFTAPWFSRGARVTVIHDLQHKRQPGNFGFFERMAWNASVGLAVRRSSHFVTVSANSKRDIEKFYGVEPERIHVVQHGVEESFRGLLNNRAFGPSLLHEAGMPEAPYLLAVSTLHPHKNWDRLLEAFERLRSQGHQLDLAVCGLPGKSWDKISKRLRGSDLEGHVHLLGWQSRRCLIGLFKYAEALVFPSTFEGFGMPVAEALTAGVPVACSDIAPLREVAGDCATYFEPTSSDAIADAIQRLLGNAGVRADMAARGIERAAQYTWRRAAEQTLAVLLEAGRY